MAAELITLFRENDWVMTTQQLLAAGISPRQIGRLERQGALVSPRRGIYVPGKVAEVASRDRAHAEAMRVGAAVARSPTGLIGSHRSAAIMHGLDLLTVMSTRAVTLTEQRRGSGSRARYRSGYPGIRMYTAGVPEAHVTTRFGTRCTTAPRTVVDLGRSGSFDAGVVVADSALRARKTTRRELEAVLARCAGWPGIVSARRAVEFSDGRSESVLESVARVVMDEHGLEPPELQARVGDDRGRIGRVDFLWRHHGTVAEADGEAQQGRRQVERDALLREAGFEVVHFTWADVVYAPQQVITAILAAFQRAERMGLGGSGRELS